MLPTLKNLPTSNFPFDADDWRSREQQRLHAEIAELTGERYTLDCRLQWVDNRIQFLLEQLTEHPTER